MRKSKRTPKHSPLNLKNILTEITTKKDGGRAGKVAHITHVSYFSHMRRMKKKSHSLGPDSLSNYNGQSVEVNNKDLDCVLGDGAKKRSVSKGRTFKIQTPYNKITSSQFANRPFDVVFHQNDNLNNDLLSGG